MRYHCFTRTSGHFTKPETSKYFLTGFILLALLNACGTVETVPPTEIKSRYANQTPEQALLTTTKRFDKAANEEYDYYSPKNWTLANEAFAKATEIAKQDKNSKEILKQLILVDRRIDSAKYIKDRVLKEYADLFEHKRILQKNKAPSSFDSEYQAQTKTLTSIISSFENFTLGSASEAEKIRNINIAALKLLKSMQALNIKVVKHNNLSHDILRMKQLETRDARNIAPLSLQQAETALKAANEYIENFVHDQDGVKNVSDKFSFSVSHLEHVINEIISLSKLDIQKLEKVVLDQEQYLQQIGQALNGIDVRNLPLPIQAESVIKTANSVLDHHTEKSSMIVELTEKNLMLENQLNKRMKNDEGANAKLKSKIKLLELDLQALEKEREKLKEDMFALQQKNIDLAIQNAKLLADMEHKQGNFKTIDRQNLSDKHDPGNDQRNIIQTSKPDNSNRREHAQLNP